jgi:Na+/glutamate symporter
MTTKEMIKLAIKIGVAVAIGEAAHDVVTGALEGIALAIVNVRKKRKERKKNHESDNNRS